MRGSRISSTRVWLVAGEVQGVGFRAGALSEAIDLSIRGFAENLPNGRVRVVGVGTTDALDRFERWLADGPPDARVERVTRVEERADYQNEVAGFVLR